ncbi:MAG: orotate phosphoribosyltransferase [Blastocatellia bacterium]|nr:orotate phosphoribosyltransferase [Blastocatellia bacterium]
MNTDKALAHFRDTDALLTGHFILTSGLHSPNYLQCALALQYPADAQTFARAIADNFVNSGIQTVASPAIGGLIIGYAVAAALNVRFIWTERQNERMTVRRGFRISPCERLLVVEDVMTTGGTTREAIDALKDRGADVVGAATVIDRSNGRADVGVPRISVVTLDVPSYPPHECPMCAAGEPTDKPGSRK